MSRHPNAHSAEWRVLGFLRIPYCAMDVQSTHKIWDLNLTTPGARLSEQH